MAIALKPETRFETLFPDLSRYDRAGVDTETTGLTHTDRPVGLSIATPDGKKRYLRWGHEKGGNNCTLAEARAWARSELNRPGLTRVFFNAQYDIRMLYNVGIDILQGDVFEDAGTSCSLLNEHEADHRLGTMGKKYLGREKSDARLNEACARIFGGKPTREAQAKNYWRAPGDVVEEYAEDDADLTLGIRDVTYPLLSQQPGNLPYIYQLETMLLPVLVKMYRAGVKVDVGQATKIQRQLRAKFAELEREWKRIPGGGFKFSERNNMINLLLSLGITPPRNPPTERMKAKGITQGNYTVDKHFLASLDHPVGKLIQDMRQVTHYADTFIQSYIFDNLQAGDFIYPQFHPTPSEFGGTITGRFSSAGGLNAQNIPARDEYWAPLIRSMFIPISEDHLWLRADYSQIEYRFFAHYAGGKIMQAYLNNPHVDFHDMVAALTGLKRKAAKSINFAKLYGAGIAKLAKTIGCTEDEAREFIDTYNARIPESVKVYNKAMNLASSRGYVLTWAGRVSRFRRGERGAFSHTHAALNKVLQGSSADLTKEAMVELDRHIDWEESPMHLTVHDELDFSIPRNKRRAIEVATTIKDVMEGFELRVPIVAEAELGENWGHCDKLEDFAMAA